MQSFLMWIGSFPCVFGYFLYLQIAHLSHHNRMGAHSVADLFESNAPYFEDGDVLHATHRMRLAGPTGPKPPPALAPLFPDGRPASVALAFFEKGWREGQAIRNMLLYAASLCLERLVLIISDRVASVTGRVDFFAAKPADGFHAVATGHARLQTAFQLAVLVLLGWRPLLYLFIAETAWSLPIHPACAMYITNHGSTTLPEGGGGGLGPDGRCQPTKSTYAGWWYDFICLVTNYHVEHHDFPNVPLLRLPRLKAMAPEFYAEPVVRSGTNLWQTVVEVFERPQFYSCMGVSRDGLRLAALAHSSGPPVPPQPFESGVDPAAAAAAGGGVSSEEPGRK